MLVGLRLWRDSRYRIVGDTQLLLPFPVTDFGAVNIIVSIMKRVFFVSEIQTFSVLDGFLKVECFCGFGSKGSIIDDSSTLRQQLFLR